MTPEFTIAVAIAIAALTCGTAAPLAGAAGGAAAAGGTAAGTVAAGGAVATTASTVTLGSMGTAAATAVGKAAITSAVISGINNKGDPRLVAKDLTSKNQMKSFAMTALTAGAVHGVSGALNVPASTTSVAARAQNVAIHRGVNVAVSTTIGGENLKDSLKSNAIGGIVDFGAGLAAQKIGEAYHASEEAEAFKAEHPDLAYMADDVPYMSPAEHLLSHGIVGGMGGLALGQNPLIHAATAVGGELTASAYKELAGDVDSKEQGIALARFASSVIALTLNGDVKDISGAIETGGRAAENNTYLGQKEMEKWEKKRQKKARQLVERGIVTQEEMDANYDSLSIADMAKIKAYHRQYVSADVKGYGGDLFIQGVQAYQDREQAQQAFRDGDRRPEIRLKSGYIFNAEMNYEVFVPRSSVTEDVKPQPEAPLQQMRVASVKGERDVDPSSPFQWSELKRDAHKLYGNSGLDAKYDYTRVLSGNLQNPEDYRNLAPFASDLKKLKDRTGSLMHKWGAGTKFYSQKLAMTTGNERLSVDAGHLGEFVVDPMLAAGGLLKGAKLTKGAIQGVSTTKKLIQSSKGAEAVSDVVSAANKGTKITERTSQIAKPGIASRAAEAMGGKAGVTVELEYKPGMDPRDFHKKVEALKDLANRGKLSVAERPIVRNENLTRQYRKNLVDRAKSMWGSTEPERVKALKVYSKLGKLTIFKIYR
ncbi:MAG: DUF637 domain-containing protein [Alphaproteobacteria bacterium]|nr:DUF637 domain-containing protein [Alphaproteobacteria bacterium]MBP9877690.1 DUF637 domain-containing protein [Alphaproteobacteria bacterium]